jgi:cyclomaltodextrinase / maltogenic alpha-amylase / neopullulanase
MNNLISFDSWNEEFKYPFGAIKVDENIDIKVKINGPIIKSINLVLIEDNQNIINKNIQDIKEIKKFQLEKHDGYFKLNFKISDKENLYFYYFEVIEENEKIHYYGKNIIDGCVHRYQSLNDINLYQLTIYKDEKVPNWFKEGILYNIFVDRFNNGNKDGRVDNPKPNSFIYANWDDTPMYIKDNKGDIIRWDFYGGNIKGITEKLDYLKDLGITIIYLSPIFKAVSNHKYDTGDYKQIDPMYGNEIIFKEFIQECELRNISVILDGVFSHTGDDSIYFNKYKNYDSIGAYESKKSEYYDWYKFDDYPDKYDCWWGIKAQPNVYELNPSYMDYIIYNNDSVLKKWMNLKIKGWRFDVADELPSKFIEEFRKEIKKIDTDSILFGEVWEDASNKVSYGTRRNYLLGNQLDSVTGYPFRDLVLSFLKKEKDSNYLYNEFMTIMENYPEEKFKSNLNILGSHDVRRLNSELNEDRDLFKMAIAIQMTFEGVPYIYYGDETGICGEKDPDNRRTYPWGKEDEELIDFYKKLIYLRKEHSTLIEGKTKFLNNDSNVFSYIRYTNEKRILVVFNRSEQDYNLDLTFINNINTIKNLFSNEEENINELIIKGKSFKIVELI